MTSGSKELMLHWRGQRYVVCFGPPLTVDPMSQRQALQQQLALVLSLASKSPELKQQLAQLLARCSPTFAWQLGHVALWRVPLQGVLLRGRLHIARVGVHESSKILALASLKPTHRAPEARALRPTQVGKTVVVNAHTSLQLFVGVDEKLFSGPLVLRSADAPHRGEPMVLQPRGGCVEISALTANGHDHWELWDLCAAAAQGRLSSWG